MVASIEQAYGEERTEAPAFGASRIRFGDITGNLPFVVGILIVLGLFAIVLFGPVWAPQNPYITGQHILPHFDREKGEFLRPPLDPSSEFPLGTDRWGSDILSMLMHGARNTLVAAAFITMIRIILGLTLGALAGWNEGQPTDRFITGVMGLLSSLPLLISVMIMIYALDIRRGLLVFIVAFSLLGWSEIAQFIRSEFMLLRQMPFIEGAYAGGLTGLQIGVRHILPNIMPQLLIITFLEMGAVLLLLGELAFVGVYIGGGSRVDLSEPLGAQKILTIAEVPEWGAMLAEGHRWLRSKPFVVFPPAMAFFISVMGFNLFGEGLRRLTEKQSLNTAFLLRKRMLLVVATLSLATYFILNNTGAAPWFAKVAESFDGGIMYTHVDRLAQMNGRSVTQPGGQEAVAYLSEKFEEYGLEPGWKRSSYTHLFETTLVQPLEQPTLSLLDVDGAVQASYRHQIDFGFMIEGHGGSGSVSAPLTFVGFDVPKKALTQRAYAGLDLRGRIVLVARENAPADFADEALLRGAVGVLWLAGDGLDAVRSQTQFANPTKSYMLAPQKPIFRIRPLVADDILAQDSLTLPQIFSERAGWQQRGQGWFTRDLNSQVKMELALSDPQPTEVPSVLGYKLGTDLDIAPELVIVFATYDGLGSDPDGTVFPAVNHDAAGVSLMLEVMRLWEEQELNTRRTTLFAAWGGGQLDESGAEAWIESISSFRHIHTHSRNSNVHPTALILLDFVGDGETLLIHPDGNSRLNGLIQETAVEVGLDVRIAEDSEFVDSDLMNLKFARTSIRLDGEILAPDEDTLDKIDQERMQKLGEMLTLTLTKIVRETRY